MAAGGAVVRYAGKRGVVWRVKYRDAEGVQVMETLGSERDGWTRRKAKAELDARVNDAKREGLVRVVPETFGSFVEGWADRHADKRELKASTRSAYQTIVDVHLKPAFGALRLDEVDVARIDAYVAGKRKAGFAARSVHRHLVCLGLIFRAAEKDGKVRSNPVGRVERPKAPRRKRGWRILSPVEVGAVVRAFDGMIAAETDPDDRVERAWIEQARVLFLVLVDTGLRRGEVLGLRWGAVSLADPAGPRLEVKETWTRWRVDTPKSESSERTVSISPSVAAELFDHLARTPYSGDDERVFASSTGTPVDVGRFAETFRTALGKAKVDGYVRPFHDLRHTSITNGAAAGMIPAALQKRAGHSSYATTQIYIDLAGEEFPEEMAKLGNRLWGGTVESSGRNQPPEASDPASPGNKKAPFPGLSEKLRD